MDGIIITLLTSFLFLIYLILFVLKKPKGEKRMIEIHHKIRLGAIAFLKKEYQNILIFVIFVALLILFTLDDKTTVKNEGLMTAISFLSGAFFSMLAGWIGMSIATSANVRTANASKKNLRDAFNVAFAGGIIMGLTTALLGLFGIYLFYRLFNNVSILFGFGLGASSVALFARVGGGIFTKAADLAADLVGKFEHGISEDDPRNPATIADNVGDNVGDVAGMGADLFESYVGSLIAAMSIGLTYGHSAVFFPLILACVGVISSILAYLFVKFLMNLEKNFILDLSHNLFLGLILSNALTLLLSWFVFSWLKLSINFFVSVIIGSITGILIGLITNHYTSETGKHAKNLAKVSLEGVANNILSGFSIGMKSTAFSIVIIAFAIILSYYFGNIYGIALAGVAMLSSLVFALGIDAYGPIADNAGGIVEMSGLPKEVRKITDKLDSLGNTTAAIGKGFAIGSAALTSLALLNALTSTMKVSLVNLITAHSIIGLFIGASLPFLFSSITLTSVNAAAGELIKEVRRQFKDEFILSGKREPDYERAITLATSKSIKEMIKPTLLVVIMPLFVGIVFGVESLISLLAGALVSGSILGLTLTNAGGVWDNAKKHIESGNYGGKNSVAHKAAVIGDTVGDPFKDTSGPSLNILIKLMTIVSLVFAPLFLKYGGLLLNFL